MQNAVKKLLYWYKSNKRTLPWRDVSDPYCTWLSEIMLQQTRVEAVKRYYERFLHVFPTIASLAAAKEDEYLKLWEGLGYYSRVRNLHKGAVQIMHEFGGSMPEKYDEIIRIAGIGPYTAAAIASIAFGEKIPAIDGNLLRIFSRLTKNDTDIKSTQCKRDSFAFFNGMMNAAEGDADIQCDFTNPFGDMNQALMDLGATVCVPNGRPQCEVCPIQKMCMANLTDTTMSYPVTTKKKARKIEKKTVLIIRDGGKIALSKRQSKGLLAGMYEFPNANGYMTLDQAVKKAQSYGFSPLVAKECGESRHIFSHKEWHMIGYEIVCDELEPRENTYAVENPEADFLRDASDETKNEHIFLAKISEIEEKYSIPSAFSHFRKSIT